MCKVTQKNPNNKVFFYDDSNQKCISEIKLNQQITNIKVNPDFIFVITINQILVSKIILILKT